MSRRILVADDSSTIQKVIKIAFARYAIEIVEAGSYLEALAAVGRAGIDALILDASLPGARGPGDFAKIMGDARGAPMLLLVGTYEVVDEPAFRQAGFQHFLKKPFESTDIVAIVDRLLGGELSGAREGAATVGPIVPPLPGSSNRAQHVTVFHQGGLEALSARGLDGPAGPTSREPHRPPPAKEPAAWAQAAADSADLPSPPTDQARKGRRAFSGDDGNEMRLSGGDARGHGVVPPPPLSLRLDDDPEVTSPRRGLAREASPLPPIPPGAGFSGQPGGDHDGSGLELPLGDDVFHAPAQPTTVRGHQPYASQASPSQAVGTVLGREAAATTAKFAAARGDGGGDELRALVEEQLPGLVRQAVEDYCERHFKGLARDVIAAELRRLADDKARQLVDN